MMLPLHKAFSHSRNASLWKDCIFHVFFLPPLQNYHLQVRLGNDVNDDVDEDPTGNKALWDRGLLNGASQKAEVVANFHVGETVNTLEVTLVLTRV